MNTLIGKSFNDSTADSPRTSSYKRNTAPQLKRFIFHLDSLLRSLGNV